jgi:hypothetical protein
MPGIDFVAAVAGTGLGAVAGTGLAVTAGVVANCSMVTVSERDWSLFSFPSVSEVVISNS